MAMTAEEIRYPDIYLEASVPAQRRSPEKSERGDPSFSSFERYFDIRGGSSGETRGQGLSASTSGANALAAQVKELQAKLAEKANELEAIKARNKLMEEHIESVGADSEGIVKVNVRVLLYAFLFVVVALCAAVAAALHWEPVGLRAARVLAGRWSEAAVCDGMCEAAAAPETPAPDEGRFFWRLWGR